MAHLLRTLQICFAVQANGTFALTPALLDTLAGGKLADGSRTLHLVAADNAGNASSFDLSFTLDTTPPAEPVFDLAPASDTDPPGDHATTAALVILQGTTEANARVKLVELDRETTAGPTAASHSTRCRLLLAIIRLPRRRPMRPATRSVTS